MKYDPAKQKHNSNYQRRLILVHSRAFEKESYEWTCKGCNRKVRGVFTCTICDEVRELDEV